MGKNKNRRYMVLAMAGMLIASTVALAASKKEEQAQVRKAGREALAALYKVQPSARKAVESATGYAAFSIFGMKILFADGGSGKGMGRGYTAVTAATP